MIGESLGDALARLGIKPQPSSDELQNMTADERVAALEGTFVTQAQYPELPQWWRDEQEQNVLQHIAEREQAAATTDEFREDEL